MADAPKRNAAGNTKVIGSDSSGNETNYVNASANLEQFVVDRLNNGGEDSVINVTAGTPVEIKVGASPRTERKLVLVQPDGKILFGFSNTTQSFRVFKNQIIRISLGPNTSFWIDAVSGTVPVSIGEVS